MRAGAKRQPRNRSTKTEAKMRRDQRKEEGLRTVKGSGEKKPPQLLEPRKKRKRGGMQVLSECSS